METKRQQRAAAKQFTKRVQATAEFLAETAYDGWQLKAEYRWRGKHGAKQGGSRAMILRDGIAYKMALNTDQIANNRHEYMSFWQFPQSVRDLTTTPYYISKCGRVIAYEYVPTMLWDDRPRHDAEMTEFNNKLRELLKAGGMSHGDADDITGDNHGNNVGIRADDSLVWLDFCPPRW